MGEGQSLRGMSLCFRWGSRAGFEVPLTKVSNTNLVGKNEVAVEFNTGKDGAGAKDEVKGDELVEMRFYVPGMKEKEKDASDAENGDDEDAGEGEEETTAASVF